MNNNKEIVVAKRVKKNLVLEFVELVFLAVIIFVIMLILLGKSFLSITLDILALFGFCFWAFFYMKKIHINNQNDKVITFNNNVFTIANNGQTLKIKKKNIISYYYKNNTTLMIFDNFVLEKKDSKCGKFFILYKQNNEEKLLKLSNIANPEEVFIKMINIVDNAKLDLDDK